MRRHPSRLKWLPPGPACEGLGRDSEEDRLPRGQQWAEETGVLVPCAMRPLSLYLKVLIKIGPKKPPGQAGPGSMTPTQMSSEKALDSRVPPAHSASPRNPTPLA